MMIIQRFKNDKFEKEFESDYIRIKTGSCHFDLRYDAVDDEIKINKCNSILPDRDILKIAPCSGNSICIK